MRTRAITGLFFVLGMLCSVSCGPYVFAGFFLLLAAGCLHEFYGLFGRRHWFGFAAGTLSFALVLAVELGFAPTSLLNLLLLLAPMVFLDRLWMRDAAAERPAPFEQIGRTLTGFAYVLLPFYCFFRLGFMGGEGVFNGRIPLGFLLMLWASDTGAYLIGRSFGRYKLFERISPKKTWEGFAGGLLSALLVAAIIHRYTAELLPLWQWLSIAVLIAVVGTLGDLVESMLKRSLGVKDSGSLLPGHGGLLDRFDGLLLAAPAVYVFLYFVL